MGWLFTIGVAVSVLWAVATLWVLFFKWLWWWSGGCRSTARCPKFPPLQNLPTDPLRPTLSKKEFPTEADAVVIGSGPSGLVTAIMLARQGKSVLVLEQHDRVGGGLHTFEHAGWEFDTGFHYSGSLSPGQPLRKIVDSLTEGFGGRFGGGVEWTFLQDGPLDNGVFDKVEFLSGSAFPDQFGVPAGRHNWISALKKRFPGEVAAIERYEKDVDSVAKFSLALQVWRTLPKRLRALTEWMVKPAVLKLSQKTGREGLDELTDNLELKALLGYVSLGCLGAPTSEIAYSLVPGLHHHFAAGAAYPSGGPSSLCRGLLYELHKAGGRVMVSAKVSQINVTGGVVTGVQVDRPTKGRSRTCSTKRQVDRIDEDLEYNPEQGYRESWDTGGGVKVTAPTVITSVGLHTTVEQLLEPDDITEETKDRVRALERTNGHLFVFVGLNGSPEDLKLPRANHWIFPELDLDRGMARFHAEGLDADSDYAFGYVGIAFPSAKDSDWSHRHPDRATAVILAGDMPWDWFAEWADARVKYRGREYAALKERIGDRLLEMMLERYPHLRDRVEYLSVGTPLDTAFYLAKSHGESYGLKMTPGKARANVEWLAPEIAGMPEGLFFTGQEVTCNGFAPSVLSALMCVAATEGPLFWFQIIPMLGGLGGTIAAFIRGWPIVGRLVS